MPTSIPQGNELKEKLRALDSKERWRLAGAARRGLPEPDPGKAAIVVALARQQLRITIVSVTGLVIWFVGFPAWRWLNDPTARNGERVIGALIGLVVVGVPITWFFIRRYRRAERLNLEVVAKSRSKKSGRKR
ncbi:MAG: hypothetical protein ACRDJV_06190 [Actinomycetota bacterium]